MTIEKKQHFPFIDILVNEQNNSLVNNIDREKTFWNTTRTPNHTSTIPNSTDYKKTTTFHKTTKNLENQGVYDNPKN